MADAAEGAVGGMALITPVLLSGTNWSPEPKQQVLPSLLNRNPTAKRSSRLAWWKNLDEPDQEMMARTSEATSFERGLTADVIAAIQEQISK